MSVQPVTNGQLCHPGEFKDNCGFGLIAHMDGKPSHRLLNTAIEALGCMTHRGGIAADGKTGDGCGLLIQKPDHFFRAVLLEEQQVELPEQYGVGMIFLNPDDAVAAKQRHVFIELASEYSLKMVVWRTVPIDKRVCGQLALEDLPLIEQVFFVAAGDECLDDAEFNRRLFYIRRKAEIAHQQDHHFYIVSLSTTVVAYKGLVMPVDLPVFFQDLSDQRLATAICVFHQRFSTNTLPRWQLAQPFRLLAHNGEINTIMGNRNWAEARTSKFKTDLLPDLESIAPLVNRTGSDSSSLDNMLELMLAGGVDLFRALRMLIPPAWQNVETMDHELKAFYEYNSMHMEPWDGPAGIVLTDGRYAICLLDRNGLRPARWVVTMDRLITLASEVGVYDYEPEHVIAKGRVGPGEILAVDTHTGKILDDHEVNELLKNRKPYKKWLRDNAIRLGSPLYSELTEGELRLQQDNPSGCRYSSVELLRLQKLFHVSFEERDQVLRPMAENAQEAVGSMGDDTPMAVLSRKIRPLTDYFRQQFAQVTNPPIDPLREAVVMSLETCLGPERNLFSETADHARRIILRSPVLSRRQFMQLTTGVGIPADKTLGKKGAYFPIGRISLNYDKNIALVVAIENVCQQAVTAAGNGKSILVLSDKDISRDTLIINAAMAVGAIHHRLIAEGMRCDCNIVVETGIARDPHQFAVLIGFGATAIYPYLAYSVLSSMVVAEEILLEQIDANENYRQAIAKGLLKIISKMGISSIASYRGAQLFEAVGLSEEVVELCFKGVASRISGATFDDLEDDQKILTQQAWVDRKPIDQGGILKYIHGGEYHAFNPDVVFALHDAVSSGDYDQYRRYSTLVQERGIANIRDLLDFRNEGVEPIPIEDVESVESILKRFDSAGMSLGALSPEAHESIAIAMNRLGGRSNSGEGGEDPERFGTERVSKIKQIASGRFGVTPHYLVNAEVLQIKIAQGAKPGEGGQLPGGKVNELIAKLRYSVPGVTLISPPPHHDIYSIEDLAQLIYDLKQVNPQALVSVKLVAEPGVGTIASGVAKAYADLITISGYDGGTAASPLTSIRYAGSPWELGLSEVQQSLRMSGLRGKIRLQTDGGLKNGVDVIKAAILGAESFGFGTIPMLALGCKYLRICHLNNCATGVATQQDQLREQHYKGKPELVMNFFRFVAMETRALLATMGCASLDALIGRTDRLMPAEGVSDQQKHLNLQPLLANKSVPEDKPQFCQVERNVPFDKGVLAQRMFAEIKASIESKKGGLFTYRVTNCDRSIGARLSGEIAKRYGNQGMSDKPISLQLKGTAGQSFGVWNAGGLHMYLEGDANDYVGKGMTGGKLVIRPPVGSLFVSHEATIVGNTCLYGATGGRFYAAGCAGERFAVRNSGAFAVVEGVGDHGCEYMTGGQVTVLGETGHNFGAGMTGGFAYVFDQKNVFFDRYNPELVDITRITSGVMDAYKNHLYSVIREFVDETGSARGAELIAAFDEYVGRFWLIKPKAASLEFLLQNIRSKPE